MLNSVALAFSVVSALALPTASVVPAPTEAASASDMLVSARVATAEGREDEAVRLYRTLAERDDTEAMFLLGQTLRSADGAARDFAEARKWLQRGAARNHAGAIVELGLMLELGEGVEANPLKRPMPIAVAPILVTRAEHISLA